uniref:Uncharacterized protein n=1 Tax=Cacopsylla melanoneura TaxID=428564 RepID=A0A8D8ZMX6_9HEMI
MEVQYCFLLHRQLLDFPFLGRTECEVLGFGLQNLFSFAFLCQSHIRLLHYHLYQIFVLVYHLCHTVVLHSHRTFPHLPHIPGFPIPNCSHYHKVLHTHLLFVVYHLVLAFGLFPFLFF